MKVFDKSQTLFRLYWYPFCAHYGRHLVKRNKADTDYVYKKCLESKQKTYAYWNEWLTSREGSDIRFTVLYNNNQTFNIGALYEVDAGDGHHIGVFIVVTRCKIYEWYVSTNSINAVYLGKVPAHRTEQHLARTTHTERFLDNRQVSLTIRGAGYYYG